MFERMGNGWHMVVNMTFITSEVASPTKAVELTE